MLILLSLDLLNNRVVSGWGMGMGRRDPHHEFGEQRNYHLALRFDRHNDSNCIKMDSGVSYFNVSVICRGQSYDKNVLAPQLVKRKESRSGVAPTFS